MNWRGIDPDQRPPKTDGLVDGTVVQCCPLLFLAATLGAGYFFDAMCTSPGPACTEQYLRVPPKEPYEGTLPHPGASHRLLTTFTMPGSACREQKRGSSPCSPYEGRVPHPAASHCLRGFSCLPVPPRRPPDLVGLRDGGVGRDAADGARLAAPRRPVTGAGGGAPSNCPSASLSSPPPPAQSEQVHICR